MRSRPCTILCTLLALPSLVLAQAASAPAPAPAPPAEPVRQIVLYVQPYYAAGATFSEAPKVSVDPAYDALLSSTRAADIRKARDAIAARPDLVSPETMMALAIRLYDVGLRDDAVFWFYAGRDRFLTMQAVLDMRSLRLARLSETVDSFVDAIAPIMDGYALCDIASHQEREDRAIAWVAAHPYKLLGYADLPAQSEDRNAALAAAVARLREISTHNRQLMSQPEVQAQLAAARKHSQADAMYCWK
jgi:hypothetical protein